MYSGPNEHDGVVRMSKFGGSLGIIPRKFGRGLYKIGKILEKCAIDSFLQPESDSNFRFVKNWLVEVKKKIDQDYWHQKLLDVSKNNMVRFLKLPCIQFCLSLTEKYILLWYLSTYCTLGLIEGVYGLYINEFEPENLAVPTKKV